MVRCEARLARATEDLDAASKELTRLKGVVKTSEKAQAKAAASKAEVQSMFAGGQDGLRLSRKGKAQANALFAEAK